ncbi:hypothetical protein [uncultured Corynebacterium sp.]|uniref:Rv3212 family protein n=1 Tax=uncultured Corynebacterium sp. TaxID=159447 RepID=UPI0025E2ADF6|nr:hypothetical protein [uncultured Corynebacterium sp.]
MSEKPLRRTRADWIATGTITALSLIAVGAVWVTAPIRGSELSTAPEPFVASQSLTTIPDTLTENWRAPDTTPGNHKPSITGGVIVAADTNTLAGYTPDGEQLWTYERDIELCSMSTGFEAAVATYRTGVGCGDVVSLTATQGQYKATRSAPADNNIAPITSNDRIGILGQQRVELWRSDLVRTVEYGEVEAKQEAGQQPFPQCSITSAMTRKELLAVTETCPDGSVFLRFQDTTPEDSREPEVTSNITIDAPEARLVAIGQDSAAVYLDAPTPRIQTYNNEGTLLEEHAVDAADFPDAPFQPATADLPHHMSWFDGQRLALFTPGQLSVGQVFDDALGTGIAIDNRLLYPTPEGIAVANWDTGDTLHTIPLNRGGYTGEISLGVAGSTIVEKRGDEIVGLSQPPGGQ